MKDQVVGTWTLESFEIEDQQSFRKPWGKESHGLLIYANTGHMSVSINRAIEQKSGNETQDYFDSILFYSGTYTINDSTITHQVTEASNPNRIGKSQIRFANLNGDLLKLSSPKESFGTAHLTWRRFTK